MQSATNANRAGISMAETHAVNPAIFEPPMAGIADTKEPSDDMRNAAMYPILCGCMQDACSQFIVPQM